MRFVRRGALVGALLAVVFVVVLPCSCVAPVEPGARATGRSRQRWAFLAAAPLSLVADVRQHNMESEVGACAIGIPPLRERRSEIPLSVHRALKRCRQQTGVEGPTRFTDAALALLCEGEYAGNVRELEGMVLCAYLFARDQGFAEIGVQHLPAELAPRLQYKRRGDREENRIVVEQVLKITGGNVKKRRDCWE